MNPDSLIEYFAPRFAAHRRKVAVTFVRNGAVETRLTYGQLDRHAGRFANYLKSLNVGRLDPVMLFLPKSVLFVVAHLAVQKLGAISVPINPEFKKAELEYLIDNTRPAAIIAGGPQAEILPATAAAATVCRLDADSAYRQPDVSRTRPVDVPALGDARNDPAIILYTSGTTGKPKGAILTHANLISDASNIDQIWQIESRDSICHALPFFHTHGLSFAFHTLLGAGGQVVMLNRFDVETALGILEHREGPLACTIFMAVPAMYNALMAKLEGRRVDFSHIRLWASGSAPLLPKDFERLRQTFGKPPVEREGMTETGMNFSNPLKGEKKPGSIGVPLPGLEVKIVDPETGRVVAAGEAGEIWLRGPGVTPGYWRNREETEKAFTDGWFRSGDIGRVDRQGYYYLIDRLKDIIISGGENISPKEVEIVINQIEAVRESAVVGIPDAKWGEKVVAAVALIPGAAINSEQLLSHCKSAIHAWKVPKEIRFVEQMPKNRMGKILRQEVRALFHR